MDKERLYFDNASTSWPKPSEMIKTLSEFYIEPIGSYGRSMDRRTLRMSSNVEKLRDKLANILGTSLSENIVFTKNATEASNIILSGIDISVGKVLISQLEHNAIIRPLRSISHKQNIDISFIPTHKDGLIDVCKLQEMDLSSYSLAIINIESNVNGIVQPIEKISSILKKNNIEIMLDASQYIDAQTQMHIDKWGVDYVVLTGHKKLMGPTGTGAMFIRNPQRVTPQFMGGNGFKSNIIDIVEEMPYRYEYGTVDMLGLNALLSAIENCGEKTLNHNVWLDFIEEIKNLDCRVLCADEIKTEIQGSCISFIPLKKNISDISSKLYHEYGIVCRDGIHCNPTAHSFLGSMPMGAIRISPNFFFHKENDIGYLYNSIKNVLQ